MRSGCAVILAHLTQALVFRVFIGVLLPSMTDCIAHVIELNLYSTFPTWRAGGWAGWYLMAQKRNLLITWLVFTARPAPPEPPLWDKRSYNPVLIMNNKGSDITWEFPRV